ncbi:trans-aconitate 2-methyltransferase [Psychromicrobium xiongbiense]|uniref:trans-aconitate 2-methyltransferase n=1 Tax=Psychromicrobium xiongbiense TaxID=3051184 RepID=UPI00255448EB|nr:trans-aconitate 2-methyltransferase [Psychromicrobium sp. YIM S02556]
MSFDADPQKFAWDPQKYVQFGDFRNRPFFDLTARILAQNPRDVVDLGCGPGNLTATLATRWPEAEVEGVDSSASMIASARRDHPAANLRFTERSIEEWAPGEQTDVVVSNAALQWVPSHRELLKDWLPRLQPGAWFALQIPGNFGAPSHVLMRELAESEAWRSVTGGILRHTDAVSEPEDYLALFLDAGMQADAWETTYQQVLPGERAVVEWVRGTALRPVLNTLSPEQAEAFEDDYTRLLDEAYPVTDHGTVFPFRRIFVVGQKKGQKK